MPMQPSRIAVHALILAVALGAARAEPLALVRDGAAADPQVAADLSRYLSAPAAYFSDWLADGSVLIASRRAGRRQIERLRSAMAPPEPLGDVPGGILATVARPYTSDAFLYVAAAPDASARPGTEGDSRAALYLQQIGAPARLLAETRSDVGVPRWAHDGRRVAFTGAAASAIYVIDTGSAAAQPRLVASVSEGRWQVLGWSIDDRTLLLGRMDAGSEDAGSSADDGLELYLADVDAGTVSPVPAFGTRVRAPRTLPTASGSVLPGRAATAVRARFASDGHAILLLTRAPCERRTAGAHEFAHLCYTDPAAGEWKQLSAAAPHDVELFDESADGSLIAYVLNDDGVGRLMLIDQHLKLESAATLPLGVIRALRFDPTGRQLALTLESPETAPGVYVLDAHSRTLVRWTPATPSEPGSAVTVQIQLVHFPTWDQIGGEPRQLSALLYRPLSATEASSTRPVVIWLCSGSRQQCRPRYAPLIKYLVEKLGFAVLAPNVRGSSGFGPAFVAAGSGALRDDAARDVGSLLVWIGLQPGLDRARVALLGEGFGSGLALTSLVEFGDRLSGAVVAFPRQAWSVPNALAIRRPVLLVQALADPQVPAYQAAQLREGLRAKGVPVQYLAAPDEQGRFEQPANRQAYSEAVATFLSHLLR